MELLPCLIDPISVRTVHNEDEALCSGVVMPPQWSDLVLTTNILKKWGERGIIVSLQPIVHVSVLRYANLQFWVLFLISFTVTCKHILLQKSSNLL